MNLIEFKEQRKLMRSTRRRLKVRRIMPVHHFGHFVFKAELIWGDRKQEIILTV